MSILVPGSKLKYTPGPLLLVLMSTLLLPVYADETILNPGFEANSSPPPTNWCASCLTSASSIETTDPPEGKNFYSMGQSASNQFIQQDNDFASPATLTTFAFYFRLDQLNAGDGNGFQVRLTVSWFSNPDPSFANLDTNIELACHAGTFITCPADDNATLRHRIRPNSGYNTTSSVWLRTAWTDFYNQENTYFIAQNPSNGIDRLDIITIETKYGARSHFDFVAFNEGPVTPGEVEPPPAPVSPYGENPAYFPCCNPVGPSALQGARLEAPDVDSIPFIYLFLILFALTLGPYLFFGKRRKSRQYEIAL